MTIQLVWAAGGPSFDPPLGGTPPPSFPAGRLDKRDAAASTSSATTFRSGDPVHARDPAVSECPVGPLRVAVGTKAISVSKTCGEIGDGGFVAVLRSERSVDRVFAEYRRQVRSQANEVSAKVTREGTGPREVAVVSADWSKVTVVDGWVLATQCFAASRAPGAELPESVALSFGACAYWKPGRYAGNVCGMASDATRRADNHESDPTALLRGYYDRVAHEYDPRWRASIANCWARQAWLVLARSGQDLEIGVGTGANLAHYPPDTSVTAIDLSPAMLAIAQQHAEELNLDIELRLGDAQDLDFADEEFDTVTATLLVSTVPDPQRVVFEMRRVLRPGGRVLLLDFARTPVAPVRWVEQALRPFAARSRFSLLREPLDYFERGRVHGGARRAVPMPGSSSTGSDAPSRRS